MLKNILPKCITNILFGDRDKFGLVPDKGDPCWLEWEKVYYNFYINNQKQSIGKIVNDAGYKILKYVDWEGKKVLEIGPGDIAYLKYIPDVDPKFYFIDIRADMLEKSVKKTKERGFNVEAIQVDKNCNTLPFPEEYFDIIVSFYSLEHIYPLEPYLLEMQRVLKKGGIVVGAIPTEGGLAWGLGRLLTSRRWLKINTKVNPDKIICWEHPNFADRIRESLEKHFNKEMITLWPFDFFKLRDFNLVEKFIFRKVE